MWRREFEMLGKLARERLYGNSLILDAPTGTGRFVSLLEAMGHRVMGLDISHHMIREFRRRSSRNKENFIVGDCEALPFHDDAFDYVVSLRFLGHLPPPARIAVLREFGRVARRGVVAGYPVLNPITKVKFKLGNLRFWLKQRRSRPWWPATPRSLAAELARAGLTITHEEKLLGPFSQISLLCLARGDAKESTESAARQHFGFAAVAKVNGRE